MGILKSSRSNRLLRVPNYKYIVVVFPLSAGVCVCVVLLQDCEREGKEHPLLANCVLHPHRALTAAICI